MSAEKEIAVVTHYFDHLGVAVFKISGDLKKGDKVKIKGHTTDFEQVISEIQAEHETIELAEKGSEVGVKVDEVTREGDKVYKI